MKKAKHIPFDTIDQSLTERFELMASMFPDKIAISDANESITYDALNNKANVIANEILGLTTKQKQVAFFLSDSIQQFISILGILKAANAYVPLDTAWPAHRFEFAVKDSMASAIITDNENYGQVKAIASAAVVINIDEINFITNTSEPNIKPRPDDIAHILYTSGSTGEPKGVFTSHKNQLHFTKRFSEFIDITPEDIFSYYFSIGFSAHAMPFLGAMLNGGTMHMYDLKKKGFPSLADFFISHGITISLMIPSVLRHFRVTLNKGFKFSKLRILLLGGESLYHNDIKQIWPFLKRHTEIINIYASTELYLARAFRIQHDTILKHNIIPIGNAIEGMDIDIVNEGGEECDPNIVGEMVIHSNYTALGYWNNPSLTKRDFHNHDGHRTFRSRDLAYKDADGLIVHVGRKDAMVKIRGQRADLGEIENTLLSNEDIQEVAVALKEDPQANKMLVGYYVSSPDKSVEMADIKNSLVRRLPEYMVPPYIMQLDTLPKTESGKTDYRSLPDPHWESLADNRDIKHAKNPVEEQLVSIFERQLEVYPIGVTENILEAAHDSLKLFVAFDTIEKQFNIKIEIDSFIETPTIEELALTIIQLQE
ncbi:MAG: non-ribosomal peptide synthetase [Bacteroidota bacterium]